jgi:recombination protein RecA
MKRASELHPGDEVLGVDTWGRVVSTTVTGHLPSARVIAPSIRIVGARRKAGRGATKFSLRCDPHQLVWSNESNGYIEASQVRPGYDVALVRSDAGLSPIQEQVLLGKMLGDGWIASNGTSAHVSWSHVVSDLPYAEWTSRGIGALDSGSSGDAVSGYGSHTVTRRTVNTLWILERFGSFVAGDRKEVPEWVRTALSPLALAFWYMDDGSLSAHEGQEDRASFATCAFSSESHLVLLEALARLGVEAKHTSHGGVSRIALNALNAERLFLLVAPYIPTSMQRKLPHRYRGGVGWLPDPCHEFRPALVHQKVESVECESLADRRVQISTGTGNLFCNGVLIQDSTGKAA